MFHKYLDRFQFWVLFILWAHDNIFLQIKFPNSPGISIGDFMQNCFSLSETKEYRIFIRAFPCTCGWISDHWMQLPILINYLTHESHIFFTLCLITKFDIDNDGGHNFYIFVKFRTWRTLRTLILVKICQTDPPHAWWITSKVSKSQIWQAWTICSRTSVQECCVGKLFQLRVCLERVNKIWTYHQLIETHVAQPLWNLVW